MRRGFRKGIAISVSSIIFVLIAAFCWIVYTDQGTGWAIRSTLKFLPVKADFRKITGTLARGVAMEGVHIEFEKWKVDIESFQLLWQPGTILYGRGIIDVVALQGVSMEDKYPHDKNPIDLTWPKVPRFLSFINGQVRTFSVKEVTYRSEGRQERVLDELRGNVIWFLGDLVLKDFFIHMPSLTASGSLKTGFSVPAFSADIAVQPKKIAGGIDTILLKTTMKKTKGPLQIQGDISIVAVSGKDRLAEGSGRMGLGHGTIELTGFTIVKKGHKGRVTATGLLDLSSTNPFVNLHINTADIDLSKEVGIDTSISGEIVLTSDFAKYAGRFDLRNSGTSWKDAALSGNIKGDYGAISLSELQGRLLGGTLLGSIKGSLDRRLSLSGSLHVRSINPGLIAPRWEGSVNMNIDGSLTLPQRASPEWALKAKVLNSVLRDRPFTGEANVQWAKGAFRLSDAEFSGHGFHLSASGNITEKLLYTVRLADLGDFVPNSHGQISVEGWIKRNKERLAGVLQGDAKMLSLFSANMDTVHVAAQFNTDGNNIVKGTMRAKTITYGGLDADSMNLAVDGTLARHELTIAVNGKKEKITTVFNGGYAKKMWQGMCTQMHVTDHLLGPFALTKPVPLKVSRERFTIDPFVLTGTGREELRFEADLGLTPKSGYVKGRWQDLGIARFQSLFTAAPYAGKMSGSATVEWPVGQTLHIVAETAFSDVALKGTSLLRILKGDAKIKWDKSGLSASWETMLGDKGKLKGDAWSKEAASFSIPKNTHFQTVWKDVDAAMFKSFLPDTLNLKGSLSGKANGLLLPEARFEIEGTAKLHEGYLAWKDTKGETGIKSENVHLDFGWKEETAKGTLSLTLSNRTRLKAECNIPLSARFPVAINPNGPVRATATGEMIEKGLLTALFPGLIEQSESNLSFDLLMEGTWNKPVFQGKALLTGASAYLYTAGLSLKDIKAEAILRNDRIDITSFALRSGPGMLNGSALIQIKDWRLVRYEGKLQGNRVRIVYLPELQVTANPDLRFEGDQQKLKIRGSILVPDARVQQAKTKNVVSASPDVVIVDARKQEKGALGVTLDTEVNVTLGDQVFINAEGIEAGLAGGVLLTSRNIDKINAKGQVEIVKGKYKRYGIDLDIDRGHVSFNGGSVELGALDILAIRKIRDPKVFNDIRAGVAITGTIRSPLVKLYSEPAMSDGDIISYTLFGKPMSKGDQTAQAGYLLQAAGMFLSKNEADSVQSQIKRVLGLDTIEVHTEEGKDALSGSIVTVGKYLSPDLYIAFGRSLFSGDNIVTTRYSFLKNWEIEGVKKGVDTGADLYYKIEFK